MHILEVNEYSNAAKEAFHEIPEYKRWFEELVKNRLCACSYGYDTGTLEAVMYELESLRLGYVLDHLEEIEAQISNRYE